MPEVNVWVLEENKQDIKGMLVIPWYTSYKNYPKNIKKIERTEKRISVSQKYDWKVVILPYFLSNDQIVQMVDAFFPKKQDCLCKGLVVDRVDRFT